MSNEHLQNYQAPANGMRRVYTPPFTDHPVPANEDNPYPFPPLSEISDGASSYPSSTSSSNLQLPGPPYDPRFPPELYEGGHFPIHEYPPHYQRAESFNGRNTQPSAGPSLNGVFHGQITSPFNHEVYVPIYSYFNNEVNRIVPNGHIRRPSHLDEAPMDISTDRPFETFMPQGINSNLNVGPIAQTPRHLPHPSVNRIEYPGVDKILSEPNIPLHMRYSDVSSTYPPSLQHNAEIATVRGLRTFGQNKWSRRGRLSQKQAHPGQTTFSAAEEVQVPPEVLQEALKVLRKHIKHQEFITNQTFEPTMEQALELLSIVEQETHVWLGELAKRDESLYRVFLKPGSNECQLCGYLGKTLPRALGHVRSKMGHKPFTCENEGCQARTCSRTRTPRRFTTKAERDDHQKRQAKEKCPYCDAVIRIAGIKRHVRHKHSDRWPGQARSERPDGRSGTEGDPSSETSP